MDVSFSAWRHAREESLTLKGDSFSFLFDRRYTNRLNRMSRVFFEAYTKATKELAAQEDRFPSLSEIDAQMESGAVYAFKDRLMKNTEFFEEVKISGVSYLVPRALRFIDASGTYTDLILNFEEGTVVLPSRRKVPAPPEEVRETAKGIYRDVGGASLEIESQGSPFEEAGQTAPALTQEETAAEEAWSEENKPAEAKPASTEYPPHIPEPFAEIEEPVLQEKPVTVATPTTPTPEPSPSRPIPPSAPPGKDKPPGKKLPWLPLALIAVAFLLATGALLYFGVPGEPSAVTSLVKYSTYLSNSSNESYLGMDIQNPDGMQNEMEMTLPPNIDRSISARGGVVTISHTKNTIVRLNSSGDSSIRIYLSGNRTSLPVDMSLAVPEGYDSGLVVHGQDYFVTRKDDTILLRFNLTQDGVDFEQSYTKKR